MKQFAAVLLIALVLATPASGQRSATPANPQSAPAPSPPPSSNSFRRPPQAKTQAEYADYNSAFALTGGAAVEAAADGFAAKYPDSELRPYLFVKAMHEYQSENNSGKMLAMGEKVLALDPDNTIALVLTATVLADSLSDTDLDRAQKIAEIKRNASRALQTMDSSFVAPVNATPEQVATAKNTLRSLADSALGIMELKNGEDAAAQADLLSAANLNTAQPDPYIWYHLALAQDRLAAASDKPQQKKKYLEALGSVNEALKYTSANPDLERLAQVEHDHLQQQIAMAESGKTVQSLPQESTSRPQP